MPVFKPCDSRLFDTGKSCQLLLREAFFLPGFYNGCNYFSSRMTISDFFGCEDLSLKFSPA